MSQQIQLDPRTNRTTINQLGEKEATKSSSPIGVVTSNAHKRLECRHNLLLMDFGINTEGCNARQRVIIILKMFEL